MASLLDLTATSGTDLQMMLLSSDASNSARFLQEHEHGGAVVRIFTRFSQVFHQGFGHRIQWLVFHGVPQSGQRTVKIQNSQPPGESDGLQPQRRQPMGGHRWQPRRKVGTSDRDWKVDEQCTVLWTRQRLQHVAASPGVHAVPAEDVL